MFMPRVNLERRAAWYKDGEPDAMSPVDAQVRRGVGRGVRCPPPLCCVPAAARCPPPLMCPAPRPSPAPPTTQVIIQDGQVLAGTLCKKTLGAAAGGLVHITWMEYGPEAARALLSQIQFTVNQWLLQVGWHGVGRGGPQAGTRLGRHATTCLLQTRTRCPAPCPCCSTASPSASAT